MSVLRTFVSTVDSLMFRHLAMVGHLSFQTPTPLCSDTHYVLSQLCSDTAMFRHPNIPILIDNNHSTPQTFVNTPLNSAYPKSSIPHVPCSSTSIFRHPNIPKPKHSNAVVPISLFSACIFKTTVPLYVPSSIFCHVAKF